MGQPAASQGQSAEGHVHITIREDEGIGLPEGRILWAGLVPIMGQVSGIELPAHGVRRPDSMRTTFLTVQAGEFGLSHIEGRP